MEIDDAGNPIEDQGKEDVEYEQGTKESDPAVSFNAILGSPSAGTMKIKGSLRGESVLLLVDCGSTHNFISHKLIQRLGIPFKIVPYFGVQIADSSIIRCNQVCQGVEIQLKGLTITQDFFPFNISDDFVLGIKWLATLNTIQANWKEMFLIFSINGKNYKVQGELPQPLPQAYLQSSDFHQTESAKKAALDMTWIYHQFSQVFEEPSSLPPSRGHYHRITLLPDSTPPNLRPYRCPHYQKNEIEAQINALLACGYIRPSSSPFASPVILVNKKDGTWRLLC
ncbi:hypothetical protein QN277_019274 [Acacia crassicarpa]|uniref:Uncharacterized protein n=1 Tax=Acacia crassicarpa TaxID=499986 RepID=A0AAE1MT95_9FABA|nr:hypothetical protein QN277_019274 [Acacia crassicarpa]